MEIYSSGRTAILNDYKECVIYGKGKPERHKLSVQNKGQKEMLQAYFDGLRLGCQPILMRDVFAVTATTFGVMKSLQEGGAIVEINI